MKRILFLFACIIIPSISYSQSDSLNQDNNSVISEINESLKSIKKTREDVGRYKIYQTENIYVLLKLDTMTGIIKLLQWSLDKSKEFETYLNYEELISGSTKENGRFELYPTKNMYQFILLDTFLGSTWHVQWGVKENERWIRRISY